MIRACVWESRDSPLQSKLRTPFSSSSTFPSVLPDTSTAKVATISEKATSSSLLRGLLSGSSVGPEYDIGSRGRFKGGSDGIEGSCWDLVAISVAERVAEFVDESWGLCGVGESWDIDGSP